MSTAADHMEGRVEGVRETLREQTRDMRASLEEAASQAQTIAESFRIQERALIEAADEASRKAGEVRQAEQDAKRGVYLRTVNRVLDGLGSVGVDLDRILENGVPADVWKRYQRGDRMAALRRLSIRVRDPIALSRVREKFADDEEFRTNASRFLADFEKLLQQADEADSGDILSASLLTADVGKTYLLMSRALDRLK